MDRKTREEICGDFDKLLKELSERIEEHVDNDSHAALCELQMMERILGIKASLAWEGKEETENDKGRV